MSFANFGIGLGAFTQGVRNGLALGQDVRNIRDQNAVRDQQQQGLASARAAREKDINARVDANPGGLPARQDFVGQAATEGFTVGNKRYNTRESASRAAGDDVGSVMDYFIRDAAPQIEQTYIQQGRPEQADAWRAWVDDRAGKAAIKDWSKGYVALNSGDDDKAAQLFGKYYTDHVDDSVDYLDHTTQKDDRGNITGFTMRLKDRDTDREHTMNMTRDDMMEFALAGNPQALFNMAYQTRTAEKAQAAELAKEGRTRAWDAEKIQYEAQLEAQKAARDQGYKLEGQSNQSALDIAKSRAEAKYKQQYGTGDDAVARASRVSSRLKELGYSDEYIKSVQPRLLGIEQQQKSPDQTLAQIIDMMSKSDTRFSRLDQKEKVRQGKALMDAISDATSEGRIDSGTSGSASNGPTGLPPRSGGQQTQGRPVLDTRTGEIVYR